jgi:hypothetical protein
MPGVALDAFGNAADRDAINPFVRLLWERGTVFERETITMLQIPFLDLSNADDADRERLTFEAMARGESLIYGGLIKADDLLGMPDLLRKEAGGYVPATSNPAGAKTAETTSTTANRKCITRFNLPFTSIFSIASTGQQRAAPSSGISSAMR